MSFLREEVKPSFSARRNPFFFFNKRRCLCVHEDTSSCWTRGHLLLWSKDKPEDTSSRSASRHVALSNKKDTRINVCLLSKTTWLLAEQEDMLSCPTRRHVVLSIKRKCLLAQQEEMSSSCLPGRRFLLIDSGNRGLRPNQVIGNSGYLGPDSIIGVDYSRVASHLYEVPVWSTTTSEQTLWLALRCRSLKVVWRLRSEVAHSALHPSHALCGVRCFVCSVAFGFLSAVVRANGFCSAALGFFLAAFVFVLLRWLVFWGRRLVSRRGGRRGACFSISTPRPSRPSVGRAPGPLQPLLGSPDQFLCAFDVFVFLYYYFLFYFYVLNMFVLVCLFSYF